MAKLHTIVVAAVSFAAASPWISQPASASEAPQLRMLVEKIGSEEAAVAEDEDIKTVHMTEEDVENIRATKAALLERLGESPMESLGLVRQPGQHWNSWSMPSDESPFRLHWHSKRRQVLVQGSYPVDADDVAEVVEHFTRQFTNYIDGSDLALTNVRFHINSGSHGDAIGKHAEPKKGINMDYAEPDFLVEDMATAALGTSAKVSVLDLGKRARACPHDALVVIDAYCYSGRGAHLAARVGDTRLLWNVDLVRFAGRLPSPDSRVWEGNVAKKSHLSMAGARAWWETADRAWLLTDVETGAMSFIGEGGFEVTKGPLKGFLAPGDVVYFDDEFYYDWQDMPEGQDGHLTLVKEPRFLSGAQLGLVETSKSMLEAVFGEGAFERAVEAAVQAENLIERMVEAAKSAVNDRFDL